MNVLVIGGTRFIGPHVVRALHAVGHRVMVFHRGTTQADLPAGVEHLHGDLANLAAHAAAFDRFAPAVVLHMIPMNGRDAEVAVRALEGCAGRLVGISSMDVYRARNRLFGIEPGPPDPVPLAEDAPLRACLYPYCGAAPGPEHPLDDYDKIPAERAILGNSRLPGTILRLPMVYGPGDTQHRLWEHLRRMDGGRAAIPLSEGRAAWRWSRGYVENVAQAIVLAGTDARAAGEVYNVGDELVLTEEEWVRAIGDAAGWKGEVVRVPEGSLPEAFGVRLDWRQHLVGDTRKLREQLGYQEEVPLAEGLRRTIAWEREHPPEAPPPEDYAAGDAALAQRASE